ncbi:MAG: hypothetical protein PUB18_02345 [bacterium]|nr:hypothetical protein [bacterium]
MKRYMIKVAIKYGILVVILVIATILVYDKGTASYYAYLENNVDDSKWIQDHINLVEDYKIGSGVLTVSMPAGLVVSNEVLRDTVDEDVRRLLINHYSIKRPLLIYNPYQNENSTVYLYFYTGDKYKFEYYITTETITVGEEVSYVRLLDTLGNDSYTNKHFYVLSDFVVGKRNNLLIRILDENDQVVDAENFILNIPNRK